MKLEMYMIVMELQGRMLPSFHQWPIGVVSGAAQNTQSVLVGGGERLIVWCV